MNLVEKYLPGIKNLIYWSILLTGVLTLILLINISDAFSSKTTWGSLFSPETAALIISFFILKTILGFKRQKLDEFLEEGEFFEDVFRKILEIAAKEADELTREKLLSNYLEELCEQDDVHEVYDELLKLSPAARQGFRATCEKIIQDDMQNLAKLIADKGNGASGYEVHHATLRMDKLQTFVDFLASH